MTTTYAGQQRFLPSTPAPGVQHWNIPIGPLPLWQRLAGPPARHLIPIMVSCWWFSYGGIWFELMSAAHDVVCTGCPWCGWTGQASFLALTTGRKDAA